METLVILQTVYFLHFASGIVQAQEQNVPPKLSTIPLPSIPNKSQSQEINGHGYLFHMFRKPTMGSRQCSSVSSYSYQISQNCRYLLRQELKSMKTFGQAPHPRIHGLAVIAIDVAKKDCQLLGQFGSDGRIFELSFCSIHPSLPLALFCCRNLEGLPKILLWMFENRMPLEENSKGQASPKVQVEASENLSSLFISEKGFEYIHFSACGTNIIAKSAESPFPEVISIAGNSVYQSGLHRAFIDCSPRAGGDFADQMQSGAISDRQELSMVPVDRMELGNPVVTEASSYNLGLSLGSSHRSVKVVQSSGETATIQNVLALPDLWNDVDRSVQVSMDSSDAKENHLNIIFHQSSKPWYDPTEHPEAHFPMLVNKHKAAMLLPQKTALNVCGKRNAVAMIENSDEVDDATRAKQKQKLLEE
jgi:hypothetical protein